MKKSLSLLLAIALVFSMIGSLAYAADDLTAQQKFDALKAKGIFAGLADGSAGLDQNMNRAQFARVAALILGLDGIGLPDTKVVTEAPFDDTPLGAWYIEEVAAVKEAELMIGNGDGTFNPTGDIQVQELAVVVSKLLNLEEVEGAEVEGAAAYAGPYIQALLDAGVTYPTNYTEAAKRELLVNLAFVADAKVNPVEPAKVSVVSAKGSGAKQITVTLDKAVDTDKATLSVRRDSSALSNLTVNWSDDKKSATIELPSAIVAAKYTVTLGGLDAEDVATATAEFQGEVEVVKYLEFLTASDTLAKADGIEVEVRAVNQYEEAASFPAGAYTIHASNYVATTLKRDSGELAIRLNLAAAARDERVPITVIHTASQITINKVFVVGDAPIISAVEFGELKIDGVTDGSRDYLRTDDKATIPMTLFDQYGVRVSNLVFFTGTGAGQIQGNTGITALVVPNDNKLTYNVEDTDGDTFYDIRLTASSVDRDTDYTVSVYAHGTGKSATKVVKFAATKVPATVEFGQFDETLAEGDGVKYLPLVVKDALGDNLSPDDIVAADAANKFIKYSTNSNVSGTPTIVAAGEHKGKVAVGPFLNKGSATINIQIVGTTSTATFGINVADKRVATSLYVSDAPASKQVLAYGGHVTPNKIKIKARDQYGKDFNSASVDINGVTTTYAVYVTTNLNKPAGVVLATDDGGVTGGEGAFALNLIHDADRFVVSQLGGDTGTIRVTYELKATNTSTNVTQTISTINRTVEVINGATASLTFEVGSVGTIWAIDGNTNAGADDLNSRHSRGLSVTAKDTAGNKVAIPGGIITDTTSSNTSVVDVDPAGRVVGDLAGKAVVTAFFTSPTGTKFASQEVTTTKDVPVVDSISVDGNVKEITEAALLGNPSIFINTLLKDLKVKDHYGSEYVRNDGHFAPGVYTNLLNIRYAVSNVKGTGTVTLDEVALQLNATAGVTSFTLSAVAPNGKTVSVDVYVN